MRIKVAVRMFDGSKRMYYVDHVETPEDARNAVKSQLLGVRTAIALCKHQPEVIELEAA